MLVVTSVFVFALRLQLWLKVGRRESRRRAAQLWARLMLWGLGIQVEVAGGVPEETALVVCNHRSYLDVPVLLAQLSGVFLSKSAVARWPVFGAAAKLQETIFVRRRCPDSRRRARLEVGRRLEGGDTVIGFPEGTTVRGPGKLPFAPGLFREAEGRGLPIVPAIVEYHDVDDCWVETEHFLTHYLRCFRKKEVRVEVRFGEPIRGHEPGAALPLVERWVDATLRQVNQDLNRSRVL